MYTGYYIGDDGYIFGPDPRHSLKFSIRDNYIVGPSHPGRFYLAEPSSDGTRYVYDASKIGYSVEYYVTKDGHFYGPAERLPWFD